MAAHCPRLRLPIQCSSCPRERSRPLRRVASPEDVLVFSMAWGAMPPVVIHSSACRSQENALPYSTFCYSRSISDRGEMLELVMRESRAPVRVRLSRLSGVHQPSISQLLSGRVDLSDEQLDRLLSCMGRRLVVRRQGVTGHRPPGGHRSRFAGDPGFERRRGTPRGGDLVDGSGQPAHRRRTMRPLASPTEEKFPISASRAAMLARSRRERRVLST